MARPDLIMSFLASTLIAAHRIVTFDTDDNTVITASSETNALLGISDLGADNAGDRLDVIMDDICEVEFGGTITRGDLLTSDSVGRAVTATIAGSRIIGIAMVSGVIGDIGTVNIVPSKI